MKKKILKATALTILIIFVIGVITNPSRRTGRTVTSLSAVRMTARADRASGEVIVRVYNLSFSFISIQGWHELQYFYGDSWQDVPQSENELFLPMSGGISTSPGARRTFTIPLERIYGDLPPGRYRIRKELRRARDRGPITDGRTHDVFAEFNWR